MPLPHIFGSEELSLHSPSIAERLPDFCVLLNPLDAETLGVDSGDQVEISDLAGDSILKIPVQIELTLPRGLLGITAGLPAFQSMKTWAQVTLKKSKSGGPVMNTGLGEAADIIGILVSVIVVAAMLIWVERRLLAVWQDRLGPNRVGPFGLMQVVADMIKMFFKEDWIPPFSDKLVFVLAPTIVFITMLTGFAVIPFAPGVGIIDFNFGLLYFLALSSLSVYSIVLAGYASNNKYSLLGGLRAAAQTVSYEVFMGISIMGVVMLSGTFNLREIVEAQRDGWFIIPQFFGFIIFLIAVVAESRRAPLDLPEAEQELVAGFHTEYSGMKFGMFFVGEYLGITLSSAIIVTLFFGGWLGPWLPPLVWFCLKTAVGIMFFILLRGALPRPRYDQLMTFGWKVLLPAALLNLLVTGAVVLSLHG